MAKTASAKPKRAKAKTKSDTINEIMDLLSKIEKQEEAVAKAEITLNDRKEAAKTAKGVWLTAVEELRNLVRTRKRWKEEAKQQPLLRQQTLANESDAEPAALPAPANVDGNGLILTPGWRGWLTSILVTYGLPDGKLAMLEKAGLDRMGKLMDAIRKEGQEDFWWKSIKGFGESGYDALTEAITRLRKARPEFQADEK